MLSFFHRYDTKKYGSEGAPLHDPCTVAWLLRPELFASGAKLAGKIVIGTVKGDLHDIGKNLVGMMCEGAGFEVIDLGFNVPPEEFISAVKEHQPDIVGMSALLTTTMRAMGHTIRALEEASDD